MVFAKMKKRTKSSSKIKSSFGNRWPTEVKQEVLSALDQGLFSRKELMEMYSIESSATIRNWQKQLGRSHASLVSSYSIADKRRIAYEVFNSGMSIEDAMAKYGVHGIRTIPGWIARYVQEYELGGRMSKKKKKEVSSKSELSAAEDLAALLKELEEAKLKALALETMIEVAEEELGVEIRKKLGAKPSDKCE